MTILRTSFLMNVSVNESNQAVNAKEVTGVNSIVTKHESEKNESAPDQGQLEEEVQIVFSRINSRH